MDAQIKIRDLWRTEEEAIRFVQDKGLQKMKK